MKILIVEDDPVVAQSLKLTLRQNGHTTDTTESGEDGVEIAKLYDYDVLIVDLGLPDMNGSEVLKRLRDEGCDTPILVLTANADLDTTVLCLQAGADDFVAKPFRTGELLARLEAVVRRNRGIAENKIKIGPVTLDLHWKEVLGEAEDGSQQPLGLTKMEFQILEIMFLNKNRTVSKPRIYEHIYDFGSDDAPTPKIIDVYVHKIRKKLKRVVRDRITIEPVWGMGYRLVGPDRQDGDTESRRTLSSASD